MNADMQCDERYGRVALQTHHEILPDILTGVHHLRMAPDQIRKLNHCSNIPIPRSHVVYQCTKLQRLSCLRCCGIVTAAG